MATGAHHQSTSFDGTRRRADSFPDWPDVIPATEAEHLLQEADIRFVTANEWRWSEGQVLKRRCLPTSNLVWIHRGRGTLTCAGITYALQAPCIQIVPAGQWHSLTHSPGQPLASVSAHFTSNLPSGEELMTLLGAPHLIPADPTVDGVMMDALAQLARLDARRPPGWQILARAEIIRAIGHLLLHYGNSFRSASQTHGHSAPQLTAVFAHIEEYLALGPIPITRLADLAGVSTTHLRSLFRRITGMTPHQYVQSRRIAQACLRLREQQQTIADLAASVGIDETRVFHRLFKRLTGMTPRQWQQDGSA
jgi:AraC-like DNA-binding protein